MAKFAKIECAVYTPNKRVDGDVIEGVARGGQFIVLAGSFSVGKSPLLLDLATSLVHGVPWCGRAVQKRPVVHIDLENPEQVLTVNTMAICDRKEVEYPKIPDEIEPYYLYSSHSQLGREAIESLINLRNNQAVIAFFRGILERKPNAVIMSDPVEMLFKVDTIKKVVVLELISSIRSVMVDFPEALLMSTFNLRKKDTKGERADLLTDPHGWLEEVCGSLDLINRSDVRLGMDFFGEDKEHRLINGVRRGESFEPVFVKPAGHIPRLAGFERCDQREINLIQGLTPKQKARYVQLKGLGAFKFEDVADVLIPHNSLHLLLKYLESHGLATAMGGGLWTVQ